MTTPTLATKLPGPAEIRAAAEDYEFFHLVRNTLDETARDWFDHAVDQAYDATHPIHRTISDRDVRILQFAPRLSHYRTPEDIEQAINGQFGISAVRYHKLLGELIDRSDVARAYPELVARMQAQRAARQAARSARRLAARSAAA